MPTTPGSASRPLVFSTSPAPGSSTAVFATISAITGSAIAFCASTMSASGLAALRGSRPVGSTTVTPGTPCAASQLFAAFAKTASVGQRLPARRSA